MHPKIIRLYIHNYRCFVNFELRPEGRILLLGYNGAGKSSIFHVLAALQDLSVWNKDASEAFPRGTLTAFGGSSEQRFEIDVASQWGVFRYMLHLVHDEKRDDDVFLARDASNFGAWCRNLLAEAPDAAQRARARCSKR